LGITNCTEQGDQQQIVLFSLREKVKVLLWLREREARHAERDDYFKPDDYFG
jgi:hypothetical protein